MKITLQDVVTRLRFKDAAAPTIEEVRYRQRFLELFPDLEAKIISYQDNPNCKCAGEIFQRINQNQQLVFDHADLLFGESVEWVTPKTIVGETMVVENDEAYSKLMRDLPAQGQHFRGLAVVPLPDGKLKLYFY